ncbi:hypothetical protein MOUN0_M02476 [Monosporozyma unispora]
MWFTRSCYRIHSHNTSRFQQFDNSSFDSLLDYFGYHTILVAISAEIHYESLYLSPSPA